MLQITIVRKRQREQMMSQPKPRTADVAKYIDENLKRVFCELENDDMPDQITDLLSVLRAQDEALKVKK